MPRPSKAAHVLGKLRVDIGLYQKDFAARVGISWRQLQDIERGKSKLTPRVAHKISAVTGVSSNWLLANDPSQPRVNIDGEVWTQRNRQQFLKLSQALNQPPETALSLLESLPCIVSLRQYLTVRLFFEKCGDIDLLLRWDECHKKAWQDFVAKSGYSLKKVTKRNLTQSELELRRYDKEMINRVLGYLKK